MNSNFLLKLLKKIKFSNKFINYFLIKKQEYFKTNYPKNKKKSYIILIVYYTEIVKSFQFIISIKNHNNFLSLH